MYGLEQPSFLGTDIIQLYFAQFRSSSHRIIGQYVFKKVDPPDSPNRLFLDSSSIGIREEDVGRNHFRNIPES